MSLDRKDLKIQALRERVSALTTEYEDKVADLRVELTINSAEFEQAMETMKAYIQELESRLSEEENVPQEISDATE